MFITLGKEIAFKDLEVGEVFFQQCDDSTLYEKKEPFEMYGEDKNAFAFYGLGSTFVEDDEFVLPIEEGDEPEDEDDEQTIQKDDLRNVLSRMSEALKGDKE